MQGYPGRLRGSCRRRQRVARLDKALHRCQLLRAVRHLRRATLSSLLRYPCIPPPPVHCAGCGVVRQPCARGCRQQKAGRLPAASMFGLLQWP